MRKVVIQKSVGLDKEELERAVKKASGNNRWLKDPGTYTLVITDVISYRKTKPEKNSPDPTWDNYQIVLETTEGAKFNHFVKVPLTDKNNFRYLNPKTPDAKPTMFPFIIYVNFLKGLGIDTSDPSVIMPITDVIFGDPEEYLLNAKLKVRVGYRGLHIRYVGKNEEGQTMYQPYLNDAPYVYDGVEVEACPGYAACENLLIGLGVDKGKLKAFPEILEVFEGEPLFEIAEEDEVAVDSSIPF